MSHIHHGDRDVISCRKVLPPGEQMQSIRPD